MNPSIRKKLALMLFLVLVPLTAWAQENRKVGLVLSGGGAKGLAHIGALKVIEESGVTIDYIGGTSMGAIVGGLYAAGYSADQLDSIFRNTDLADLVQDNVPRSSKTFYEKDEADRYALSLPFDGFRVSFPAGISTGQDIYNKLAQLLYHVKDVRDFNRLPIPFVCIATNIETGEPVILKEGYLPEAIMASGTLPSLFEPAQIGDKVLIDGGVVNNYPLEQVKALGADIIIGVDVQHGLANRESLASATEILLQINNYRTVKDMVKKRQETDIYIQPNIEPYSVIDFLKTDEIVETGVIAARMHVEELKELALQQRVPKGPRQQVAIPDSLVINRLVLTGDNSFSRGYVKGLLRFDMGERISFKKLSQGTNNLAATDNFKAIRYQLLQKDLGTDLVLNLNEKPNRLYVKVGAHYDDLFKSAALINLTRKKLIFKDDVSSMDMILGDHIRYNFEYFQDKGTYWSFGVNSSFASLDEEVNFDLVQHVFNLENTEGLNEINLDVSDLTNQIYLQTVVKEEFALRLGLEHKRLSFSSRTIDPPATEQTVFSAPRRFYFEKSNYYSAFGKLRLDTYDDSYFPTSGLFFDGNFHLYLLSSDFNSNFNEFSVAQARMGAAFGILPKLSLNIETEGGFKLGSTDVTSFDFILGGFGNQRVHNIIPFMGYDFLSLPGNSYVKALFRFDYQASPKTHLLLNANIAKVQDDLFKTGEWFSAPDFVGFGTGMGFETIIGPIQLYYSWSPYTAQSDVFISVGYWF